LQTPDRQAFDFEERREGETVVFGLKGRITLEGAARLRKAFWDALHDVPTRTLILQLDEVPSLDPSALSLFVATKNVAAKRRAELVLEGLSKPNRELLARIHLLEYFSVRDATDQPE